jgi:hypothetical protein
MLAINCCLYFSVEFSSVSYITSLEKDGFKSTGEVFSGTRLMELWKIHRKCKDRTFQKISQTVQCHVEIRCAV